MKSMIRKLAASAALVLVASGASAAVLNFDDLTGTLDFSNGTPYGGLTFTSTPIPADPFVTVGSWFWSDNNTGKAYYSSAFTSVSTQLNPDNVVTDSESITSPVDFLFGGASFTAWTDADDSNTVQFKMFNNGVQVCTSGVLSLTWNDPSAFLASGCNVLVDEIKVTSRQGYFAMDDFTILRSNAVPEPGGITLALAALGGLAFTARRRRNDKA